MPSVDELLLERVELQEGAARAGPLCALGDLFIDKNAVQRAVSALEACALESCLPLSQAPLGLAYERAARI